MWGETEPDAAATSGKWGRGGVLGEKDTAETLKRAKASGPRKEKQASRLPVALPTPPPAQRRLAAFIGYELNELQLQSQ